MRESEESNEEVTYARGEGYPIVQRGAPDSIEIFDVMLAWSKAVAEGFVWLMNHEANVSLEECWLAQDQALVATYRQGGLAHGVELGIRYSELYVDRTAGGVLCDCPRGASSSDSLSQASNIVHVTPIGFGVPSIQWVDPDGRRWWGDIPDCGWHEAVRGPREMTIFPVSS